MQITTYPINGPLLIQPKVYGDHRGYFIETFNRKKFREATGLDLEFVQDNESRSNYGVLRGLHFQRPPWAQAKLVRVIEGKVQDVVVDIREDSPTFGQHISVILSGENKHQFFVPRGFAHGFAVLSESAIFAYKVDNYYAPDHDAGIRFDDPELGIAWMLPEGELRLSEKDGSLPGFAEYRRMVDSG